MFNIFFRAVNDVSTSLFKAVFDTEPKKKEHVVPVCSLFLDGVINSSQKAHHYRQTVLRPLAQNPSVDLVIDLAGIKHEEDMFIVDAFLLCGLSPNKYEVINRRHRLIPSAEKRKPLSKRKH